MNEAPPQNSDVFSEIYARIEEEGILDDLHSFNDARPTEDADIIIEQYGRLKTDRYFDFEAFVSVCFEWSHEEE